MIMDDEVLYYLDYIFGQRLGAKGVLYNCKWCGFNKEASTYEPLRNIGQKNFSCVYAYTRHSDYSTFQRLLREDKLSRYHYKQKVGELINVSEQPTYIQWIQKIHEKNRQYDSQKNRKEYQKKKRYHEENKSEARLEMEQNNLKLVKLNTDYGKLMIVSDIDEQQKAISPNSSMVLKPAYEKYLSLVKVEVLPESKSPHLLEHCVFDNEVQHIKLMKQETLECKDSQSNLQQSHIKVDQQKRVHNGQKDISESLHEDIIEYLQQRGSFKILNLEILRMRDQLEKARIKKILKHHFGILMRGNPTREPLNLDLHFIVKLENVNPGTALVTFMEAHIYANDLLKKYITKHNLEFPNLFQYFNDE